MKKIPATIACLLFAALCIFVSLNKHSKSGYFNYHSAIWADRAAYYVYLPALFDYHFDAASFPDSIEAKTGGGFRLNRESGIVTTITTYGVAFMELPFFLIAKITSNPSKDYPAGFTRTHTKMIYLSGVFYALLGLFFLFAFLRKNFKSSLAIIGLFAVFCGTNLFYYAIDEPGMSHVYSFALFSLFLYLTQKTRHLAQRKKGSLLLFGITAGLIILIRPLNILFLFTFFIPFSDDDPGFREKIRILFNLKSLAIIIPSVILVFLPQMIYWNYAFGSPFFYSYGDQGFYWTHPQWLKAWFAPHNGLFPYTPLFFLITATILYLCFKKKFTGIPILLLLLILAYSLSCWWSWYFGCSFGARSYVEYYALFSYPLLFGLQNAARSKKWLFIGMIFLIVMACIINIKLSYTYDNCFYGSSDWDWTEYIRLLTGPTK
jgi:hypothetical protein